MHYLLQESSIQIKREFRKIYILVTFCYLQTQDYSTAGWWSTHCYHRTWTWGPLSSLHPFMPLCCDCLLVKSRSVKKYFLWCTVCLFTCRWDLLLSLRQRSFSSAADRWRGWPSGYCTSCPAVKQKTKNPENKWKLTSIDHCFPVVYRGKHIAQYRGSTVKHRKHRPFSRPVCSPHLKQLHAQSADETAVVVFHYQTHSAPEETERVQLQLKVKQETLTSKHSIRR